MKTITITLNKQELANQIKAARREIMLDVPQKKNQAFKDKTAYTRKDKHKSKTGNNE